MRRVEDMVCRICEGMDAITAESIQVQKFNGRKIVENCVQVSPKGVDSMPSCKVKYCMR